VVLGWDLGLSGILTSSHSARIVILKEGEDVIMDNAITLMVAVFGAMDIPVLGLTRSMFRPIINVRTLCLSCGTLLPVNI